MIQNQTIRIPQSVDRVVSIGVLDENGVAMDETLFTASEFNVTQEDGTGTVLITKSLGSGIVTASNGHIEVTLSDTDTNITPGRYWWEARVTTVAGGTDVVAKGRFFVEASV